MFILFDFNQFDTESCWEIVVDFYVSPFIKNRFTKKKLNGQSIEFRCNHSFFTIWDSVPLLYARDSKSVWPECSSDKCVEYDSVRLTSCRWMLKMQNISNKLNENKKSRNWRNILNCSSVFKILNEWNKTIFNWILINTQLKLSSVYVSSINYAIFCFLLLFDSTCQLSIECRVSSVECRVRCVL